MNEGVLVSPAAIYRPVSINRASRGVVEVYIGPDFVERRILCRGFQEDQLVFEVEFPLGAESLTWAKIVPSYVDAVIGKFILLWQRMCGLHYDLKNGIKMHDGSISKLANAHFETFRLEFGRRFDARIAE